MDISSLTFRFTHSLAHFSEELAIDTKTQKVALKAVAAGAAAFAGICLSSLSCSASLSAIPLLSLAWSAYLTSNNIKDYESVEELYEMRSKGKKMEFAALVKEHLSVEKIVFYGIVTPQELGEKFAAHIKDKPLAEVLKEYSLSYMIKNGLMHVGQIRKLFIESMQSVRRVEELCFEIDELQLGELKSFAVISLQEYDILRDIQGLERAVDERRRGSLLKINTAFLGRRDAILKDLSRKEARCREDLHKEYLQEKERSPQTIYNLQGQLRAIQMEQKRVQADEVIGKDLQVAYDLQRGEIYQKSQEEQKEVEEQFLEVKKYFIES